MKSLDRQSSRQHGYVLRESISEATYRFVQKWMFPTESKLRTATTTLVSKTLPTPFFARFACIIKQIVHVARFITKFVFSRFHFAGRQRCVTNVTKRLCLVWRKILLWGSHLWPNYSNFTTLFSNRGILSIHSGAMQHSPNRPLRCVMKNTRGWASGFVIAMFYLVLFPTSTGI